MAKRKKIRSSYKGGVRGRGVGQSACAYAKNPRKAVGAALKKLGAATAKRSGAFAGLGKK